MARAQAGPLRRYVRTARQTPTATKLLCAFQSVLAEGGADCSLSGLPCSVALPWVLPLAIYRARLDLELAQKLATQEASERGVSVGEVAPLLEAALVELQAREKDDGAKTQPA